MAAGCTVVGTGGTATTNGPTGDWKRRRCSRIYNPMRGAKTATVITLPGPPTSLNGGRSSCYIEPSFAGRRDVRSACVAARTRKRKLFSGMSALARLERVKNLLVPFQASGEPLPVNPLLLGAGEERVPIVPRTSDTFRTA
jgi:hypothetical protein